MIRRNVWGRIQQVNTHTHTLTDSHTHKSLHEKLLSSITKRRQRSCKRKEKSDVKEEGKTEEERARQGAGDVGWGTSDGFKRHDRLDVVVILPLMFLATINDKN